MRRFLMPFAALCAVALLAPSAWAQTPPSPPVPSAPPSPPPVPPAPPSPPAPIPTPEVPEPSPPSDPTGIETPGAEDEPEEGTVRTPGTPATAPALDTIWWDIGYRYPGTYSTTRLLSLMDSVERAGLSEKLARRAAAPFIIAGYARFWDSWGEVRRAETGLRPHLGQDVFCTYGAPVLASENGTLEYGQDATGGLVARVHRGDGSYWYYAHLSGFEPTRSSGEEVNPGDVIGYCGTSGNAAGTQPHVHFGFYVNHVAQNPMGALIGWLERAEAHASKLLKKQLRRRPEKEAPEAAKLPLTSALAEVPGPRCYEPLPKEPLELVVGELPTEA